MCGSARAGADRCPAVDPGRADRRPGDVAGDGAAAGPSVPHQGPVGHRHPPETLPAGSRWTSSRGRGLRRLHRTTRVLGRARPGLCATGSSTIRLTLARGVTMTCAQAATRLLTGSRRWELRSAGAGSKGQRWYAWALLETASPRHTCCVRRHWAAVSWPFTPDSTEGPARGLARLSRDAGLRCPVEEDFEFGKDCPGGGQSRSACIPQSPATSCWSWPHWRSAPLPPPYCATAPIPKRQPHCTRSAAAR